ncbi:hypothetical protein [Pleurocapsa sp. PCC 7327]|uniref:hypothetical protein n=1 Tax=Pleurocapsa sp. PCC 7327 TaxID=118163 RepID=UPI00059D983D|nr:hypothetical protein [Pleurocapsa sp. PCC 7327]
MTLSFSQCVARGGGTGGGGYYSEVIELVDKDNSISLREQAIQTIRYDYDPQGNPTPGSDNVNVLDYKQGDLSGYIAFTTNSPAFNGVVFMGEIPGIEKILTIYTKCDCDTTVEDLKGLLSRVRLIKNIIY